MNGTPTLSEVVKFIKFVITRCDDGLAILLGNVDPPSSVMLYELKRGAQTEYGVRIDGGDDVPKAQNILENRAEEIVGYLGGWKNINQAFNAYRAQYPETWTLFEMCALFVRPGGEFRDGKGGHEYIVLFLYHSLPFSLLCCSNLPPYIISDITYFFYFISFCKCCILTLNRFIIYLLCVLKLVA